MSTQHERLSNMARIFTRKSYEAETALAQLIAALQMELPRTTETCAADVRQRLADVQRVVAEIAALEMLREEEQAMDN